MMVKSNIIVNEKKKNLKQNYQDYNKLRYQLETKVKKQEQPLKHIQAKLHKLHNQLNFLHKFLNFCSFDSSKNFAF